ncbi:TetR/AcrR family transcriptional regulator [Amycolatopsis pithecellobii]|uniref:TetR family transcriptional regulator n=1 Tax=Amycolatopsis pithecellobii TaxID=664692 RepID=A0A6N7ZD41_9PSEU|nr:TetR/AcrR family transcriptional regulator [Amycolatopsis pithecellobii]MTD59589.1 TetR family transcriptional regulator [Amycolatopsis pithecellobii]
MTASAHRTRGRPPRRADAEQNRQRVLHAAASLYAARGLTVSLNEIAKAAGVGLATLQRNFPHREDLVVAVFTTQVSAYADAAEKALENPDPWAGFQEFVETVFAMQCEDHGFAAVLTAALSPSTELHQARLRAYRGFSKLARRAKNAGVLRPDFSPTDLPLFLLANAGVVGGTGTTATKASRRLAAFLLQSCRAEGQPRLPPAPPPSLLLKSLQESGSPPA